jgi:two-component system, NtrC family, sensor kinase
MKTSTEATVYLFSTKDLLDKINAIGMAAYDASGIDDLLKVSLRHTVDLFNAQRGSVYLIDKNEQELILKAALGMKLSEQKRLVKRLGEGIVGRVAQLKKPLRVEDISKDTRFKNYKSRTSYQSPSFICAPLMIKDKLIGVINIADKESGEPFTRQDLDLLDFLSNQIALNYQRVNLNQNLTHILKESESLSEEAKRLKTQVTLHERLATLGKLAGGIAHEFNNPLDGVMRYTNLAIDHLREDDVVVKEYLIEVRQGLKRMANIVKSLLACARNTQPSMSSVDVNKCVDQTIKEFHSHLFRKNIAVDKILQRNLPEITDLGVERILSNLMSNAIDATPERGKIAIETSASRGFLKIVFWNSGKPILKEHMERIFEPFFTTKNIDQGCGLGLTIVSEIVKHYKGDIELESAPQKGTTFTIRLPIES